MRDFNIHYSDAAYRGGTAFHTATYTLSLNSLGHVTVSNATFGSSLNNIEVLLGVHPGGTAPIEPGFPQSFVGSGSFLSTSSGFAHTATVDVFSTSLEDPSDLITFTYDGAGGYNVSY